MSDEDKEPLIKDVLSMGLKVMDSVQAHLQDDFSGRMSLELQKTLGGDAPHLSVSECHALDTIYENPGISSSGIARMLGLTRGGASKMLSRLESKGCIFAEPKEGNKKERAIVLTNIGEASVVAHARLHNAALAAWSKKMESCTLSDLEAAKRILDELCKER